MEYLIGRRATAVRTLGMPSGPAASAADPGVRVDQARGGLRESA
jgi:hypothetical protein